MDTSWSWLRVTSANLVKNKQARERMRGTTNAAEEVAVVVRGALTADPGAKESVVVEGGGLHFGSELPEAVESSVELLREDKEVKAKLFLASFDADAVKAAVDAVLKKIDSTYVDSVQLCVPASSLNTLAMGPEPRPQNEAFENDVAQMLTFWQQLQSIVGPTGSVRAVGVCDLDTEALKRLYKSAEFKPSSVIVNLSSCCVIPTELQDFARESGLKVLTHSDPDTLLQENTLSEISATAVDGLGALGKLGLDWVIRFQVMDRYRGVLSDKRYIVNLNRSA